MDSGLPGQHRERLYSEIKNMCVQMTCAVSQLYKLQGNAFPSSIIALKVRDWFHSFVQNTVVLSTFYMFHVIRT